MGMLPRILSGPRVIAIDGDGHIWVVDAGQGQVKVFNQSGRLLIYFGGQGYFPGQFMGPWGITIDKFNRVIVSETFPGRVQMFRYVTDEEYAAEKQKRESEPANKPAVAPAKTADPPANANPPAPAASKTPTSK